MKRRSLSLLVVLGFVMMAGCHSGTTDPVDPGDDPPPPPTDKGLSMCDDGTLNCYVQFPDGGTTINNYYTNPVYNFGKTYEQCIISCMPASCTNDAIMDPVEEASTECPTEFESCEGLCNLLSNESPLSNIPESDALVIPENPKVVEVRITACFDWNTEEELHFQGATMYFHRENSGRRKVQKETDGKNYKYVDFRHSVGRSNGCPDELKQKMQVSFQPLGSSSLTIGEESDTKTISIVPFTNTMKIDRTFKMPNSVPFGIPPAIREEIDLSEVAWLPKEFGEITPKTYQHKNHMDNVMALNDFRYYANDIPYGQSMIFLSYFGRGNPRPKQTITMYGFFKSRDEQ